MARMRQITVYPARTHVSDIAMLIIALFTVMLILFLLFPLATMAKTMSSVLGNFLSIVLIASAAVLPLLACSRLVKQNARRRSRRMHPLRSARLERIAAHKEAWERLPHRMIEWRLLGDRSPEATLKKLVKQVPIPELIVIARPRDEKLPPPIVTRHGFEPIDIENDYDQMEWLVALGNKRSIELIERDEFDPQSYDRNVIEPNDTTDAAPVSFGTRIIGGVLSISGFVIAIGLPLAGIGYVLFMLIDAVRNPTPSNLIFPGIIAIGIVYGAIQAFIRRQNVFLIPGGLAIRVTRYTGRHAEVIRLTPERTTLVMYAGTVHLITQDGMTFTLECMFEISAVLTAWFNQAPTPTQQQLELLLDPHGRKTD